MRFAACLLGRVFFLVLLCGTATSFVHSQKDISLDLKRARGLEMLESIRDLLKQEYYDPKFRGLDIEASYASAREMIRKADSTDLINIVIAQFLLDLEDSHTFFIPAERMGFAYYGIKFGMIGEACFVTGVAKGSDAESKGVKIGDRIMAIGSIPPTRDSLWKVEYLIRELNPREWLTLSMGGSDGKTKEITVQAKYVKYDDFEKELIKKEKERSEKAVECAPRVNNISICRLSTFSTTTSKIDKLMKEISGSDGLVLDLRDNPGGYVKTLSTLISYFFDKDVPLGTSKGRKKEWIETAKSKGKNSYSGKLVVLVNSRSASGSEIFARIVQIEKRGVVIGERTAGAVMLSRRFEKPLMNRTGMPIFRYVPFGASITIADWKMSDGGSLEKNGVDPDQKMIPTAADLRTFRDPLFAHGMSLLGGTLDASAAGKLFETDFDELPVYTKEN